MLFVLAVLLLPCLAGAQVDPFGVPEALRGYALLACSDLSISGNAVVDSRGLLDGTVGEAGHVWSSSDVVLDGSSELHGDALAAGLVHVDGGPLVSGSIVNGADSFECFPVDLAALQAQLEASNDNGLIPRTDKNRDPLGGDDGRELTVKANDTLRIPAGTYLLSKLTVLSHGQIIPEGTVRILVTGETKVTGGGSLNHAGNPYHLRLWSKAPIRIHA